MAQKRKAQEAFGTAKGQLSAFAAAKLARQSRISTEVQPQEPDLAPDSHALAAEAANIPYDGHHSRASTPSERSVEDEEVITTPVKRSNVVFSTFVTKKGNVLHDDNEQLELVLQHDEPITLVGEYELEVVDPTGAALMYGGIIRQQHGRQAVYAPSTHALPSIRALTDRTVVRITSGNSKLRKLERLSPLFRNMWADDPGRGRSFALLGSSQDDTLERSLHLLEVDRDMEAVLHAIASNNRQRKAKPRVVAIGAKSSGKSTFNRLLSNFILTSTDAKKLLYLEIDPGQPEFGPPGQISLIEVAASILGPPFAHPASNTSRDFRLLRSHTIAATHFKEDPEHYLACVQDLIRYANPNLPLIVNSCGWVSGVGATISVDIASMIDATDIVLMEPVDDTLAQTLRRKSSDTTFHRLPRRAPKPTHRTPAESRAMQTMAYFHHRPSTTHHPPKWSNKSISKSRPWIVSYAGDDCGISAIMSYGQSPNPEFLAEVLDGSIVAICILEYAVESPTTFFESSASAFTEAETAQADIVVERTIVEQLPYILTDPNGFNRRLNPLTSHCIGLALVRGIDVEKKEIYLVTPVLESEVAALQDKQVVLVRGSFDAPAWAYLEDLYSSGDRPSSFDSEARPWISETELVGIEGSVWRLRHPPVPSAIATSR